jgi:GntR family transcriptional regulator/MocR family aminotransferase
MNNSPDFDFFTKVILVDKGVSQPIYIQASQQIINAIQRNYFLKGTKLPGTRLLSKLLQVHRNTAVAIYNELESQGWVEIIPK